MAEENEYFKQAALLIQYTFLLSIYTNGLSNLWWYFCQLIIIIWGVYHDCALNFR